MNIISVMFDTLLQRHSMFQQDKETTGVFSFLTDQSCIFLCRQIAIKFRSSVHNKDWFHSCGKQTQTIGVRIVWVIDERMDVLSYD